MIRICCNVKCAQRLECKLFAAALDANSGKISDYEIVECVNYNFFEK